MTSPDQEPTAFAQSLKWIGQERDLIENLADVNHLEGYGPLLEQLTPGQMQDLVSMSQTPSYYTTLETNYRRMLICQTAGAVTNFIEKNVFRWLKAPSGLRERLCRQIRTGVQVDLKSLDVDVSNITTNPFLNEPVSKSSPFYPLHAAAEKISMDQIRALPFSEKELAHFLGLALNFPQTRSCFLVGLDVLRDENEKIGDDPEEVYEAREREYERRYWMDKEDWLIKRTEILKRREAWEKANHRELGVWYWEQGEEGNYYLSTKPSFNPLEWISECGAEGVDVRDGVKKYTFALVEYVKDYHEDTSWDWRK